MFTKMKNMLGLQEEIQQKTNGFTRMNNTYFDKHDLDTNGKAKEKPFVPISMKIALLLNWSKLVCEDNCVADIYAHIEKWLEIGNRSLLDQFKANMAKHTRNIAEQEMEA